MIPLTGFNTI